MRDEIKVGSRWHNVDTGCESVVTSIVRGEIYYTFTFGSREGLCDNCPEKAFRRYYEHVSDPKEPTGTTPAHYDFDPEPIDAIAAWGLNFNMGNVVKYVVRADRKGTPLEDLDKALDYLNHEIAERRKGAAK